MINLRNKKGFTLIELLAVIIILGVLLLIAVPTVSKYIESSRLKTYKNNLLKMVDAVSTEVNAYQGDYSFNTKEYLVVPFSCIEVESGATDRSPFGKYVEENTFIIVTRDNDNQFEYYVSALDDKGYGSALSLAEDIEVKIVKNDEVGRITESGIDLGISAVFFVGKEAKYITCDSFVPKDDGTLAGMILANNEAKDTKGIDFGKPSSSSNGKGLYSMNDDDGVSYFFRGDVTNNYVQFGETNVEKEGYVVATYLYSYSDFGYERYDTKSECEHSDEYTDSVDPVYCYFIEDEGKYAVVFEFQVDSPTASYGDTVYSSYDECETSTEFKKIVYDDLSQAYYEKYCEVTMFSINVPLLWRVVRINGDGSVRLISEVTNDTMEIYTSVSGQFINYASSNTKTAVDSWYVKHLSKYSNYLEDTTYCNDRSFGANARLSGVNAKPVLTCSRQEYRFTNTIGLITADEVVLAGAQYTGFENLGSGSSSYLKYNVGSSYFATMTPSYEEDGETVNFYGINNGGLFSEQNGIGYIMDDAMIRPVINLKANTKATGSGTKNNPYVVK